MSRKFHKRISRRHRRHSKRMQIPGLKNIGNKSVSNVKKGVSGIFGFFKNGLGLAFDTAKQGVKQGSRVLSLKSRTRKHRKH